MGIGTWIKWIYGKTEHKPTKIDEHPTSIEAVAKPVTADEKILAELKEIIKPYLGRDYVGREIQPSDRFDDILIDSLTGVELIVELENKYFIQIPDKDIHNCETVEDAVKYLHNIQRR